MSNIAAACGIVTSPPLFSHFGWNGLRVKREASMKFAAWRRNDPNLMISQMSKPCKCLQIRAAAGTKPANASSSLEVLKKIDLGAMAYEGMDILRFLASKSILITGCTGFVGKVLLEKILRVQPNVGRIYVLIRGKDSESVKARFRKQVLDKELFQVLRQQHGSNYENFMLHKVVPVMGDIRMNNLGIIESIREDLLDKIDIIVNSAATTSFDERYDVSMKTNTNGVINVIEFGKQCRKLKILLHVSTAYVHGERKGLIKERPLFMGDTLTHDVYSGGEIPFLDIDAECNLIETTRNKILADGSSSLWEAEKTVTWRMKELGLERARKFGWPNTYVFTKAMGEMLIAHLRGDLPVAILRPTAIESTLAEPFPGWMEGNRVFDPLILGYGKGRLSSFVGAPGLLADVVPVDTVAKAMIAAIARHGMEPPCLSVYHIASSVANPLTYTNIYEYTYTYFSSKPYKDKEGRPVKLPKFKHLPSLQGFRQYTMLRYWLHIQILRVAGNVFGGIFKRQHKRLLSEYSYIMKLAELYEPYLLNFYARFDVSNTDHLLSMLSDEDRKMFDFNVRNFDWTDYMLNVHIPGLVKHILKR